MSDFVNTIEALGNDAVVDSFCNRTITEFKDDTLQIVGEAVFANQPVTTVILPNVTKVLSSAFNNCSSLKVVDFTKVSLFGLWVFQNTRAMTALIIRNEKQVPNFVHSTSPNFANHLPGITSGGGFIYVPAKMIDTYKSTFHWSDLAQYYRALEDYTVDGTVTGDLDETKI